MKFICCFICFSAMDHPNLRKMFKLGFNECFKDQFCFVLNIKNFPSLVKALIFLFPFLHRDISHRSESVVISKRQPVLLSQIVSFPI